MAMAMSMAKAMATWLMAYPIPRTPRQFFQSPLIYVNLDIYVPHCARSRNSISPRLHRSGRESGWWRIGGQWEVFSALRHMLRNYNLLSL